MNIYYLLDLYIAQKYIYRKEKKITKKNCSFKTLKTQKLYICKWVANTI